MEGGEGNRAVWTEEGEVGSGFDGEESGKKKGWMGETGHGDSLVGEVGSGAGFMTDDSEGHETVDEGVVEAKRCRAEGEK